MAKRPVVIVHGYSDKGESEFFHPFTTTLVQIRMNREPMPLALSQRAQILDLLPSF